MSLLLYSNRVENMNKVTDCNELENLAEVSIFIWGTAPGGCRFKNEKDFSNTNDELRLFYLLSKTFSVVKGETQDQKRIEEGSRRRRRTFSVK
jgi:hypothetical protein